LFTALVLAATGVARADVLLWVGYYDLAPPAGGNTSALPNPWFGSGNTTFLGSSSQATSGDPDEAAILFTNTGAAAVTLNQGVTVTAGGTSYTLWDSLIGAGGLSILPGKGVILAGTAANSFDGSDIGLNDSTISFDLNGVAYSAVDSNSILHGNPIGPANDETEPWTQIGDFLKSGGGGPTGAPEPASLGLLGVGLAGVALIVKRRKP